tara:strand:- start:5220 stop:5675 length:456 start_codon:yes stop_codon:yes gene_type:complete
MKTEFNISIEEAKSRLSELVGAVVSHAWRGHGSALFLELGQLEESPKGNNPKGEQTIMLDCSWRVEGKNSIILGSSSDIEEIDKFPGLVIGKTLGKVEFYGRLPEINIKFNNSLWLLTFMTDEGSPEWSIKLKSGEWLGVSDGEFQIEKST